MHSEKKQAGFVEFYDRHNIMPVRQDINDKNFLENRNFLYRSLGLPMSLLKDLKVLEFGPGGGFNAIALTNSGSVASYSCVEGSKVGHVLLEEHYANKLIRAEEFKIYSEDFLAFDSVENFDLVIAEACIPGQENPAQVLAHIAKFVREEGYLVITCTSKSSQLSEILRSVYAAAIRNSFETEEEFQHQLRNIFSNHLAELGTKTRSVEDWIDDNINQRWHLRKADFNANEAMNVLTNFEFVDSNPQQMLDLSWYKSYSSSKGAREKYIQSNYSRISLMYLDMRITPEQLLAFDEKEISLASYLIDEVYDAAKDVLACDASNESIFKLISMIEDLTQNAFIKELPICNSLKELNHLLKSDKSLVHDLTHFPKWWGRGQQYLSFMRKKA